jgi:serine O-acetyltransferase
MFRFVRNHYGVELPVTAAIGRRVIIGHQAGIVIHAHAVIGDDCFLRQNVTLGAINAERGDEAPTLGRGVSLGCGAVILGGITIGDRARIGPNTVVMTDVPADTSVFTSAPRMITLPNRLAPALPRAEPRLAGIEA